MQNLFNFDRLNFLTAGMPLSTGKGSYKKAFQILKEMNLDGMELEFVHGVRISGESKKTVASAVKENNFILTAHGPFYINLNSKEEENFYLKHTLNGEYSPSGTVFLDYQNDKNMENQVSRLWGHNLYGENMFGDLTEYQNQGQSFYDQNKTYTLYTEKGVYQLEVFAALEEDASTQNFDYSNQDEFLNDMNTNKEESNFTSNTKINPNDQIIIFACCTDDSNDLYTNNRFSVYTKVTPIYEYNLNNSKTL